MKKITLTAILIAFTFLGFAQTKIGLDFQGEDTWHEFGQGVALSDNGTIMAIGTGASNGSSLTAGYVKVYQRDASNNWMQIGAKIEGDAVNDNFGYSIALSADGTILAIGAQQVTGGASQTGNGYVKVYQNVGGTWTQIGSTLVGDVSGDRFGSAVALSANGTVLAVGAHLYDVVVDPETTDNSAGQVKVFNFSGGAWNQLGADIVGAARFDNLGNSVSLSDNGTIMAVGIQGTDVGGSVSGSANIYQYSGGLWNQVGAAIDGEAGGDRAGYSVSLSGDGSMVAVGAYNNDGTGSNAGHVRVFENVGGTWTQVGADIDGDTAGDTSGRSVSLSNDGTVLAIGSDGYDGSDGTIGSAGQIRIFKNVSGTWTKIGNDILGGDAGDQMGESLALSGDGNTLAAAAYQWDIVVGGSVTSTWVGLVQTYDLSAVLSTDSFVLANFSVYPNPTSDVVNISLTQDLELQKVNIYNTLGQLVRTDDKNIISVNNLSKGSYFFEVITNKGKATKTIIVK